MFSELVNSLFQTDACIRVMPTARVKVGRSAVTQSVFVRTLFMDTTDAPIRMSIFNYIKQVKYICTCLEIFGYSFQILKHYDLILHVYLYW